MTRWTKADEQHLREREGLEPMSKIAGHLGRTMHACEVKLSRLKGGAHRQFERRQMFGSVSRETVQSNRRNG